MARVVGAAVHTGWAVFVAVEASGRAPRLVDRWRVGLVAPGQADSPYHHQALRLPLPEAEALVASVRGSVAALAHAALEDARQRHGASAVVFESSPYDVLPDSLAEVLASWALTCAADAMMYRDIVADRARALGIEVVRYPRKVDVIAMAARELGWDVDRAVKGLGATLGPPWTREHRAAAAAAILVLGRRGEL